MVFANSSKELTHAITNLDSHKYSKRIKQDLKPYTKHEQALGLALAWTESTWNYNAKHYGGQAVGVCGIMPKYWKSFLAKKQVKVNSIGACIEVYKYYKNLHNGNRAKAIKSYKGISKRVDLVIKTLRLKDVAYNNL